MKLPWLVPFGWFSHSMASITVPSYLWMTIVKRHETEHVQLQSDKLTSQKAKAALTGCGLFFHLFRMTWSRIHDAATISGYVFLMYINIFKNYSWTLCWLFCWIAFILAEKFHAVHVFMFIEFTLSWFNLWQINYLWMRTNNPCDVLSKLVPWLLREQKGHLCVVQSVRPWREQLMMLSLYSVILDNINLPKWLLICLHFHYSQDLNCILVLRLSVNYYLMILISAPRSWSIFPS